MADFGLSTYQNTPLSKVIYKKCGTPGYVAPEVLFFDEENESSLYSFKVDVFSAGIILYYLMTGKQPLKGKNQK